MSNPDSFETLVSLAYGELRVLARSLMRNQRPGHTLQTTGLVHEAYLRLNKGATDFESAPISSERPRAPCVRS
jgi:hypothetical protein